MPERIWEKLFKLCEVLHWLGKYEEMQAISHFAALLRDEGVEHHEQIDYIIKKFKGKIE